MMKLHLVYLTLWSVSEAAYISRMALNRIRPTAFRPGVMMQRPWPHQRMGPQASHRAPYVIYRNQAQHRYAVKHYSHNAQRNAYPTWKTTPRLPTSVTAEYEFVRAASQPTQIHTDGGAIHTIPAPNLSLSEKPIVVIDTDNINSVTSEASKPIYEVTEKYPEHSVYQQIPAKIEQPIGFSKATSLTTPELEALIRNGAALQVASELGLSALSLPQQSNQQHFVPQQQILNQQQHSRLPQEHVSHQQQHSRLPQEHVSHQQQHSRLPQEHISHQQQHSRIPQEHISQQQFVPQEHISRQQQQSRIPQQQILHQQQSPQQHNQFIHQVIPHQPIIQHVIPQQPIVSQQSIIPQQFTLQAINSLPNQQELLQASPEGLVISPNALYQPDPAFLQKLQNQLLQRFPGVEFIPYAADVPQVQNVQIIAQESQVQPLFLLQNEQIIKQTPSSFVVNESNQKIVAQRETQEGTIVTLVPEVITNNVTDNLIEVASASEPQNTTVEVISESQPATTTIKYVIETNNEVHNTTPIYYAQVGQSVGDVIANGFYSAINDVRAASAAAQAENTQEPEKIKEPAKIQENITTTTLNPELKAYFVEKPEIDDKNQTVKEIKPLLGVPFAKAPDSVNVAYTLLRTDDKGAKVTKDGSVYAGQIVEATISEDHDFNKEKASMLSRRAPIRLVAVPEKLDANTTDAPQKVTVVKAKIPPKSKLTFDDKTGEPVLRIYASYVDSPIQKEILTSKLSNLKHVREATRKQDTIENWKTATVQAQEKSQGYDANRVTQFGLKLRSRSDDYMPLFEDYEE